MKMLGKRFWTILWISGLAGCSSSSDQQDPSCGFGPVACPQIAFTEHPKNATVNAGGEASFSVVVSSVATNPVQVWWERCDAGKPIDTCDWQGIISFQGFFGVTVSDVPASLNGARYRAKAIAADGQVLYSLPATLTVVSAAGPLDPIGFTDGAFLVGDWTLTNQLGGLGGSAQVAQVASGGHPGAYRSVKHQVNAAPDTATTSRVFSFHIKTGALYDPATSGAIVAIDYAQESRLISLGGSAQGTSLALRQGGQLYYATSAYQAITAADWATQGHTGLVAADFVAVAADASQTDQHPDFSASGPAIQFGFLRANSTSFGGGGYAVESGIDNWSVVVRRAP